MLENLTIVALIVIIFWLIILGVFIVIARRQPNVQTDLKALDEQLEQSERGTVKQ